MKDGYKIYNKLKCKYVNTSNKEETFYFVSGNTSIYKVFISKDRNKHIQIQNKNNFIIESE